MVGIFSNLTRTRPSPWTCWCDHINININDPCVFNNAMCRDSKENIKSPEASGFSLLNQCFIGLFFFSYCELRRPGPAAARTCGSQDLRRPGPTAARTYGGQGLRSPSHRVISTYSIFQKLHDSYIPKLHDSYLSRIHIDV